MYTFKTNINKEEFNEFVSSHEYCNLLQSYQWADIKNNWGHIHTGVYNDEGKLAAAGLVLIKHLPAGFTMFYLPRGPILDYTDMELLRFYFDELKKIAKKQKCLFIKVDPAVEAREYNYGEDVPDYDAKGLHIIENLKAIGAKHHGFTKLIAETAQPRYHMGVRKTDDLDKHVPAATRRSKNTALRKHVEVEVADQSGLAAFAEVMKMTEKRKNVSLRNEEYFRELMETYPDSSYLFLASADPTVREKELQEIIAENKTLLASEELGKKATKKAEDALKQAEQELESMQEILAKYKEKTVIAGGLMLGFGHYVEMLYAGMNDDFRTFRPQYLTYMEQFHYAYDHGYDYVTMGGVEGTLDDGLSIYKRSFNPVVIEYIGEFDIPVNRLLFKAAEFAYRKYRERALKEMESE